MNELIKVKENETGEIVVSGRELHEGLSIETPYAKWINRMFEYGFEEGTDYVSKSEIVHGQKSPRAYEQMNHALTLDMAKEISMIQRTEKGKEARQYFIQVEKAWNSPEMIMQRALKIANNTNQQLQIQIERDKPKVLFADSLAGSKTSILVGELAKLISQNGYRIGQNRLFEWLRGNNYVIRREGETYNLPTQRSMELGLMELKKGVISNADGSTRVTRVTKVTAKGQQYFINKFLGGE